MDDRYVVVDDLLERIIDEQETRLAEERSGADGDVGHPVGDPGFQRWRFVPPNQAG